MPNKVASIFDSIGKIGGVLIVLFSGLVSCVLAWVQIESNKIDLQQFKIDIENESTIRDARAEKRYKRALRLGSELKETDKILIEIVKQLEISSAVNNALDEQSRSELNNLWKNYNEELNKQIKNK